MEAPLTFHDLYAEAREGTAEPLASWRQGPNGLLVIRVRRADGRVWQAWERQGGEEAHEVTL